MEEEFFLSPIENDQEKKQENLLRPKDFSEFIGQKNIID